LCWQILLEKQEDSPTKSKKGKKSMPEKTLPMIPEVCFAYSEDNQNPARLQAHLDKDGMSQLLVCEDCKVCVHASKHSRDHRRQTNQYTI
jgi:jumonji domain-containing protein 2